MPSKYVKKNNGPKGLKDLTKIKPIEWARLAAYIDGEGCVHTAMTVHKDPEFQGARKKYEYIKVYVANTNPILMSWLQDVFGGRVTVRTLQNAAHKTSYEWVVSCKQAEAILKGCLPYLILKSEQAKIALAIQATMIYAGRRGTPPAVIEERAKLMDKIHALNRKGSDPGKPTTAVN